MGDGRPPPGGPARGATTVNRNARLWTIALAAAPVIFVVVFLVVPVGAMIDRGLRPGGELDLGVVVEVARDPTIRDVLWFTLVESVLSTFACLLLGLPGAAMFALYRFPGRRLLWSALLVPFVLPAVIVGVAMLAVIGPDGVSGVTLSGSMTAIVLAHVFFNYAVVVRTVGAAWSGLDPTTVESARTLGASPMRAFVTVTLPALRGALLAAASIVFLFSFTSFGVVLILGDLTQRTIEVEIFEQTTRFLQLDVAAVLVLIQLIVVVGALTVFSRLGRRDPVGVGPRDSEDLATGPPGRAGRLFIAANLAVIVGLLVIPLSVLVIRSFETASGWGFGNFRSLLSARRGSTAFVDPGEAILNSLNYAIQATVIAVVLGTLAAVAIAGRGIRRRSSRGGGMVELVLMIPLGTSAVTVGFGFLITFDRAPFDLRGSTLLIPIAHALIALPFVVRLMVPALRAVDPVVRDAAAVLGASPRRIVTAIDLPVVGRSFAAATGFAFAVSLGEFGATVFLARPQRPTIPLAIYRALGRPGEGNYGQALALAVLLMVVTVVIMMAVDRARPTSTAGF